MADSTSPRSTLSRPGFRRLEAPWVSAAWVDEAFEHQRRVDPFGHSVHAWLGALACLCLGAPTTVAELGWIPVGVAFLIRVHRHHQTWMRLFLQPQVMVMGVWMLLAGASGLWTHGPTRAWLEEAGTARFGLLALVLWPVADRRALLLGALAAGFALGQASQVVHGLGTALGVDWMRWNRLPGRNSGWWDPVVGGSLLTAVLGLHLPAALWGRGVWRVLGAAGAGVTGLGILATGTRGAWIAGAGLVAVALVVAALRVRPRARLVRRGLGLVGVGAVAGAIAWATLGEEIGARVEKARTEIAGAIERKEFQTDTGARLLMAWWAVEAVGEHPVRGVGLGGFEAWSREHVVEQGIDQAARNFHAHAHNTYLQVAATLGVPGLLVALLYFTLAIRGAAARQPGDGPPGYADGPCFAMIGLVLVGMFDSIQVNSHTAALMSLLTIFVVQQRPARSPRGP